MRIDRSSGAHLLRMIRDDLHIWPHQNKYIICIMRAHKQSRAHTNIRAILSCKCGAGASIVDTRAVGVQTLIHTNNSHADACAH